MVQEPDCPARMLGNAPGGVGGPFVGFAMIEQRTTPVETVFATFSVATNNKGFLSKTMSIDPTTGAVKKGGACSLYREGTRLNTALLQCWRITS